ncbi:MAG: chromate transporter [Candidatus Limnocylindria bacterium]
MTGVEPRPSARSQLQAWIVIGTQSFGGGASTLYLMRAILVGRRNWLSLRDFFQEWTLSRLSLGNHLTALAALLGQRIGGRRGVVLAVTGLLIPSGIITAILTGGFGLIRDQPAIQSALAGIAPVTIGMMMGISYILVRTILSPRSLALLVDLAVFGIAAAAGFFLAGSTIMVIVSGAVVGTLFLGRDEVPPETLEA